MPAEITLLRAPGRSTTTATYSYNKQTRIAKDTRVVCMSRLAFPSSYRILPPSAAHHRHLYVSLNASYRTQGACSGKSVTPFSHASQHLFFLLSFVRQAPAQGTREGCSVTEPAPLLCPSPPTLPLLCFRPLFLSLSSPLLAPLLTPLPLLPGVVCRAKHIINLCPTPACPALKRHPL